MRWIKPGRRGMIALILAMLALMPAAQAKKVLREGRKISKSEAQTYDLEKARAAAEAGNYDEALRLYQAFLTEFPEAREIPQVRQKMGEIYYSRQDYPAARREFEAVARHYPARPEALDAAWGLALLAYQTEDYAAAAQEAAALYPRMPADKRRDKVGLMAAESYSRTGRFVSAAGFYAKVAREGAVPEQRDKAREQAQALITNRLTPDELDELLAADGNAFPAEPALMALADKCYANGETDRARKAAQRLLERFAGSGAAEWAKQLLQRIERQNQVDANRIGLLLPLSGPRAALGQRVLQGAALAAQVFGSTSTPYPLELCIRDTGDNPELAARAVEELVLDEHVIALIGPLQRSAAEAAIAKAQELEVPITVLAPLEKFSFPGGMVFQNSLTRTDQIQALLDWSMTQEGMKKFAVLYPSDPYGAEFAEAFAAEVTTRGGTVVNKVDYPTDETDFSPQIARLLGLSEDQLRRYREKKQGPPIGFEALFLPDGWDMAAMITPQLRFHKLTGVQLLGVSSWHTEEILQQARPADLEGAVFADAFAPELDLPQYVEYDYLFRKTYGSPPTLLETLGYETVMVSLHLVRDLHVTDRVKFAEELHRTKNYPQLLGPISVEASGEWRRPLPLFTFRKGSLELLRSE